MTALRQDRLNPNHFMTTLGVAALAHLAAFGVWMASPSSAVVDIPVKVLNIRLGDGEELETAETLAQPAQAQNSRSVEKALKRLSAGHVSNDAANVSDKALNAKPAKVMPVTQSTAVNETPAAKVDPFGNPVVSSLEDSARQFVRARAAEGTDIPSTPAAASPPSGGSVLGNSAAGDAEALQRYEQSISAWIQKFKVYPEEARKQGMEGEGVIRVRIDRQGNVQYRIIERRTGSAILDKAAIEMVQRANPVPPVPVDYPAKGEMFEFLIPVSFKMK